MTLESQQWASPRIRDLLDLAWILSDEGDVDLVDAVPLDDELLAGLWGATRELSTTWQKRLDRIPVKRLQADDPFVVAEFESLAVEVLAAEQVLCLWSTVVVTAGRRREDRTVQTIADNLLTSVRYVRRRLLETVVQAGEPVVAVDQFRRRCERWTDLMIGPWIVRFGVASYAHEARRAWDHGEDHLASDEPELARRILQETYQRAFMGRLTEGTLEGREWVALWNLLLEFAGIDGALAALQAETPAVLPTSQSPTTNEFPRHVGLLAHCLQRVAARTADEQTPAKSSLPEQG